jgi:hypothetical protein
MLTHSWPSCWTAPATSCTLIPADGFSCRTQIQAGQLGRQGIHLAQLLAGMLEEGGDSHASTGAERR